MPLTPGPPPVGAQKLDPLAEQPALPRSLKRPPVGPPLNTLKRPRRIALVGTASSRQFAPVDDKTWEIWGLAARGDQIHRADRWFELHRLDGEPKDWADAWRKNIREFSQDCEVVMMYPEPDLGPKVTAYPSERIINRFGTYFMQSTFSWVMALAIEEMAPFNMPLPLPGSCEIGIWGVDMEYGTEYKEQRTGFRHFIQVAHLLGITVNREASSGLAFEPVPYPMWQDDPLLNKAKLRIAQTKHKLKEWEESLRRTHNMIAQNRALIAEYKDRNLQTNDKKRVPALQAELDGLMKTSANLSRDISTAEGAHEEQAWLLDYLSP